MIDQSLLQNNFIGRDGFLWWIGQIPPLESMGAQVKGGGWGNRYKVRIIGYHPYSESELPNEDLPWAQVLIPATAGSGAANVSTGIQLQQGDTVLGFFLDGDNAQIPVILASFGRTDLVSTKEYSSPFVPFTGYNSLIPKAKTTPSESSELKQNSQPSPQDITFEQAITLSEKYKYKVYSVNEVIGDKVLLANPLQNTKTSRIKSIVTNLLKKVNRVAGEIDKIRRFIRVAVDKIVALMNEYVGALMNALITTLISLLKEGLKLLYELVYAKVLAATGNPVAAHLAGVAAQRAMLDPVNKLQKAFACVAGEVIDLLKDIVTDILTDVVNNVDRFVTCVEDQFVGSLLNAVIDTLETLMAGPLDLVSRLLQFFTDFTVGNLMRSIIGDLARIGVSFDCNQSFDSFKGLVNEWIVGGGPANAIQNPYDSIKQIVDIQNSGIDPNKILDCFSDAIAIASPPIIDIFGGIGSGATAVPIFGNIVQDEDGSVKGSVIGAQITNPGSGYTFPPFVQIYDDNEQGYGALARSTINENGELESIYIISEGENYSVGNIREYSIVDILVEEGGSGYNENDIVVDNYGNEYFTQISDGAIYQVNSLNTSYSEEQTTQATQSFQSFQSLPVLTVKTDAGNGAILRPILGKVTTDPSLTPEGEIVGSAESVRPDTKKSIDCPI